MVTEGIPALEHIMLYAIRLTTICKYPLPSTMLHQTDNHPVESGGTISRFILPIISAP